MVNVKNILFDVSSEFSDSKVVEIDPKDLISDLTQFEEGREKQWNVYFDKYEKMESVAEVFIHNFKLCSSDNMKPHTLKKDKVPNLNKSRIIASKLNKKPIPYAERKHVSSNRSFIKGSKLKDVAFLGNWTTRHEINKFTNFFESNNINLEKVARVIERDLKSDLKQLLVECEESRYLQDKSYKAKYEIALQEAERLKKCIGKEFVVIYISLYKCSMPFREIRRLIEVDLDGNLVEYLPKNVRRGISNARISTILHKRFVKEWNRLKEVVPVDYLVEYCLMLELAIDQLEKQRKKSLREKC